MSNLVKFPKQKAQGDITATPNGLHINGRMVSYAEAIEQLECGDYDNVPQLGRTLIWQIKKGVDKRYFKSTMQHVLSLYRWTVADMFYMEQEDENGTHELDNGDVGAIYIGKHGGMVIYRVTDRLAMANNIEGALIEKYGADIGVKNAITFYIAMINTEMGELSSMGREVLTDLHDSFIRELHDNGLPAEPAKH